MCIPSCAKVAKFLTHTMQSFGLSVHKAADVCEFVLMCAHESPSAAEFDTDGEPSCLDAIDRNPMFLSKHTHTRLLSLPSPFPPF